MRARISPAVMAFASIAVLSAQWAEACSVPVFRYALERWRPDPYLVVVFHRGTLDAEHTKIVKQFEEFQGPDQVANLRVVDVDLDQLKPDERDDDRFLAEEWERQKTDVLPWVVVDYPVPTKNRVFEGPLTAFEDKKALASLVDSPIRQEIKKRILGNHTGVFLLLEGSDKEANEAAAKLIEAEIPKMEKSLKLPDIDPNDVKAGLISVDPDQLKIKFSMLRLKRDTPAEKWFVKILLGSDADFNLFDKEYDTTPIMFPVFGRGRSLPCLIEQGINQERLHEVGSALTQSCTCEIKNQNPGIDLLMSVDWDALVEIREVDQELPPLMGLGQFVGPDKKNANQGKAGDVVAKANTPDNEDAPKFDGKPAAGSNDDSTGKTDTPSDAQNTGGDDTPAKNTLPVTNPDDSDDPSEDASSDGSSSADQEASRWSELLAGKVTMVAIVGGIIVVMSTWLAIRRG